MENILGIDIGGSGIKGSLVNIEKGEFYEERYRIETPGNAGPDEILGIIKQIVDHFNYDGIMGCGFPGVVQNGVVKTAANLSKAWIGINIENKIEDVSGCKNIVINDADAAGIAEFTFGAGKGFKGLVLLLTIGTGIGSVLSYNGTLVPNTEFGHLQFNNMIAEKYTSDAAKKKNDLSRGEWGERFNEYLLYLENLIWPDLIIIGGGVSKKFAKYQHKITTRTKVIPAELLNSAGIIGAAVYADKMLT